MAAMRLTLGAARRAVRHCSSFTASAAAAPSAAASPSLLPQRAGRALACGGPGVVPAALSSPSSAGLLPRRSGATASAWRSFAAAAGEASGNASPPLNCSSSTNIGRFAGAIAARIRAEQAAVITTVGPTASYMALKALIIAQKYLADDLAGKTLVVVPSKETRQSSSEGPREDVVCNVLHVQPMDLPSELVAAPTQPDVFSAGNTNVGLMAGLMAQRLKAESSVTLGGMGAKAISSVLKATMIAEGFVADSLGLSEKLALVPSTNVFEEHGESRTRMLLRCIRIPR